MRPSRRLLRFAVTLAGIAILAAMAGPAVAGTGKGPGLVVVRVSAERGAVVATVANVAPKSMTGTVRIEVPVGDRVTIVERRVTVPEGRKAFLVFRLPDAKQDVIPFGAVLDDGIPF